MKIKTMHPSIIENCPGFVFPHMFMEGLPEEFEAYEPSESEKRRLLSNVLQIDGTLKDYFYGEKAEFIHSGKVRDVRRYPNGSQMIRVDAFELGSYVVRESDYQLLMLIDAEGRVRRYTFMCDEFKPAGGFTLQLVYHHSVGTGLTCADEPKILNRIRNTGPGQELLIGPMDCLHRGFRVERLDNQDAELYAVSFFFYHPPWVFGIDQVTVEQLDEMLQTYMREGLAKIVMEYECRYCNVCSTSCSRGRTEMGVYMRLLHHRFVAVYEHDEETLALLDKVSVFETRTPPLWMPRRLDAPWCEVIDDLYRNVTSPTPHNASGDPIPQLDIHRILVYCALEGHALARQWVEDYL